MTIEAFDFAEQFQTPVFVMTDLDLGHEQLDGRSVRRIPRSRSSAARCSPPKTSSGWAGSPATKMWMATAWATARCPAPTTRPRRTSRAAAATTRRRSTPSAKTTTSTTWTGWRTSSKSMRKHVPRAGGATRTKERKIGFVAVGTSRLRGAAKAATSSQAEYEIEASYLRLKAYPFHSATAGLHPPPRARLRGGSEPRRRSCWA